MFEGGITNAGVIDAQTTSAAAIKIFGNTFKGGIDNSGTIRSDSSTTIYVSNMLFQGGITNSGWIESGSDDAIVISSATFQGGIDNQSAGVIEASDDGIRVNSSVTFEGGINNDGLIDSTGSGNALDIRASIFEGGITNSGTLWSGSSADAVRITGTTFNGGLTNSGEIYGDNDGVFVSATTFTGGINNQAGGYIDSSGLTNIAINITATQFSGGITNAGTIGGDASTGIHFSGGTFSGGIDNSGTISGTLIGVNLAGSVFNGGITNSGLIESQGSTSDAIHITTTTFNGGVNNQATGVIRAADTNTALYIASTTFSGGITNAGQIFGGSTSGYGIYSSATAFSGGIDNTGTIEAGDTAIFLTGGSFTGGIVNDGLIASTGTGYGIHTNEFAFTGGIDNQSNGVIRGSGAGFTGLWVDDGSFDGGVTNAGTIIGGGAGTPDGFRISAGTFTGGVENAGTGLISGRNTGLQIDTNNFSGGLTNAGSIVSTVAGRGVSLNGATFNGGVDNSGYIKGQGATGTGLFIDNTTFNGGLTNSGTILGDYPGVNISVTNWTGGINNDGGLIQGTGTGADGLRLNATNFSGDFTNSGSILGGTANNSGVDFWANNFSGNFDNSGVISGYARGAFFDGKLYSGNFSNSGMIDGFNGEGLRLAMDMLAGNVTNDGTITAAFDALKVVGGTTITGDVTNNGNIVSSSSDAVDVNGLIQGALTNTGLMSASGNALDLDGTIEGGIFNSGTMISTSEGAVDLTSESAAHTLTQTAGGLISDSGTAGYAINMSNGFVDTFNANGGAVEGDIIGGVTRDDMITSAGTFAWVYGTGSGLDEFDVDGGTSILGASARGDDGGEGVWVNTANSMNVAGWVYLDDDTTIDLNNGFVATGTGTVEYFLTTNEAVHGTINASTINLAGDIAVYLDPASFAAAVIPTTTTLLYDDVLNSSVSRTGTFDNSSNIITSSIFFEGEAIYDGGGDVDIELRRLAFDAALAAAGATETSNQDSVAAAIETIYGAGGYSSDFQDFLTLLFGGGLTPEEYQAILDDIAGAEHAQLQGAMLNLAGILNGFMGERLDSGLLTLGGTQMGSAASAEKRYAQAVAIAASDASGVGGYGSHGLTRGASGAGIWARGFGQWVNVDGDPEAAGYNHDSSGLAAGVDYAIGNNAAIGLAGSYADSDVDFNTPGDSANVESWQVGAYGSYGFGSFYADGLASYSSHDLSTLRTIQPPVPDAPFTAEASYNASSWSVAGEVGAIWKLGRVNMQPSAGLAYTGSDTDGFTETGTGSNGIFNLIVQGADADSLASTLALRGFGTWTMGQTRVVPDLKLGWRHEFNDDRQTFTAAFAEDPTTLFQIVSSKIQPDSLVVSTGATFGVTQNFEVFFDVNGQYNADASLTNASGGVRLTW